MYYKYVGNSVNKEAWFIKYFGNKLQIVKTDFDMKRKYFFMGNKFANIEVQYPYKDKTSSDVLEPYEKEDDKHYKALYSVGENFIRSKTLDYDLGFKYKQSLLVKLYLKEEGIKERVCPDNIITLRPGNGLIDKRGREMCIEEIKEGFEMPLKNGIAYKNHLAYYRGYTRGKEIIISNEDIKEVPTC